MGGEKVLVGLRGAKTFSIAFRIVFRILFRVFQTVFRIDLKFFGGKFVLHACRPNQFGNPLFDSRKSGHLRAGSAGSTSMVLPNAVSERKPWGFTLSPLDRHQPLPKVSGTAQHPHPKAHKKGLFNGLRGRKILSIASALHAQGRTSPKGFRAFSCCLSSSRKRARSSPRNLQNQARIFPEICAEMRPKTLGLFFGAQTNSQPFFATP